MTECAFIIKKGFLRITVVYVEHMLLVQTKLLPAISHVELLQVIISLCTHAFTQALTFSSR